MADGSDLWDDILCFGAADIRLLDQDPASASLDQDGLDTLDLLESSPRKTKRRRPNAAKEELTALKQSIHDLTRQLEALTESRSKNPTSQLNTSIWAVAARHERIEARRAMDENTALRTAVDERATSIDHLQRIFLKKTAPFASHPSTHDLWRNYHLPAAMSHRPAAIHAIADMQRRRHVQVFIRAGVLDQDADLYQAKPITLPDHRPGLQVINHVNLPIPYQVASAACWESLAGTRRPPLLPTAHETLEHIDDRTIYDRFTEALETEPPLPMQPQRALAVSNTIRKLFRGPDKDVVVCRTVLHDAAHPVAGSCASATLVDDMAGWMVVRPHPDAPATTCRFTSIFQVPLEAHGVQNSPRTSYDMKAILALIHTMSFVPDSATTTDTRPTMRMSSQSLDLTAITTPVPSMGTFLGRGKEFELAIKASLNAAIAAYHAAPTPVQPAAAATRRPVEATV